MTEQSVLQQVKDYVVENFMYMRKVKTVGEDESLLRTGVITSLGMMEVVGWVEDTYGVTVDPDEITEQNFDTLRGIAGFVLRKRNVQAA
jgi:acyl carrier protein